MTWLLFQGTFPLGRLMSQGVHLSSYITQTNSSAINKQSASLDASKFVTYPTARRGKGTETLSNDSQLHS